jgi:predicted DNA-binding transcriptional regulator AlpA
MSRDPRDDIRLLDARGVAALLSISPRSVWRWCAVGDFPRPIRLAHGVTRWRLADVRRWLDRRSGPRPAHREAADQRSAAPLGRVGT